jgi:hypothetical protein
MALSHYTRLKLTVYGDPNLCVGQIINVILPSNRSEKDGSGFNEGLFDLYHSGRYLISAVRHVIKSNMKYDTVIEVVKDSLGAGLPNWNNPEIFEIAKGK